jgi:DNA-binding transcriptional LysR family regulator
MMPAGRLSELTANPLADRQSIKFSEIINEPVAALPASAGSQRDFWLAVDARAGRSPRVAAEVSAADEKFEIVLSGAAITLLAGRGQRRHLLARGDRLHPGQRP